MGKRRYILMVLIGAMLVGCGKKDAGNDIDVSISAPEQETVEDTAGKQPGEEKKENTGKESLGEEKNVVTEVKETDKEVPEIKDSLETYGEAIFLEDGSIGVVFEGNVLSTEEEKKDQTIYRVKLADIANYKASRTDQSGDTEADEAWVATMVKTYMKGKEIPAGMEIKEGDTVSIEILSSGGIQEYENKVGEQYDICLGNEDATLEAEEVLYASEAGEEVKIPFTDPSTGETVYANAKVLGVTGDRELDDLNEEWLAINYPELKTKEEFLEWIKGKKRQPSNTLDIDKEFSFLLDYLVENSEVDGIEPGSRASYMLVEIAYLASHDILITQDAYNAYLSDGNEGDGNAFVTEKLKEAMHEDLGGGGE